MDSSAQSFQDETDNRLGNLEQASSLNPTEIAQIKTDLDFEPKNAKINQELNEAFMSSKNEIAGLVENGPESNQEINKELVEKYKEYHMLGPEVGNGEVIDRSNNEPMPVTVRVKQEDNKLVFSLETKQGENLGYT